MAFDTRELNLPDVNKPMDTWTSNEIDGAATLGLAVAKHLDVDIDDVERMTYRELISAVCEAARQGKIPNAFYDGLIQAADRRHGGRIQ
jgi:hypothetical protein